MTLLSTVAILPLLTFANPEKSELGGIVTGHLSSPEPVRLDLYAGTALVASARPDLFGRYTLASPPGDYWLKLNVGGHEARVERLLLRAGSWSIDFDVWDAVADRAQVARSEVCGQVLGRNGKGITATVLAYSDDRCVAGARADVRGNYCLTAPPGTYWLRASAAGADVGYTRVRLTPGSVRQDVRSEVEVIELPPVEVSSRVSGDHSMRG